MRLHVDLDTRAIITALNDKRQLSRVDFKRGDSSIIDVVFVRDGVAQELDIANGELGQLGIKPSGEYDAGFLVSDGSWVKSGTGSDTVYSFEPNFNTLQLNAALGSGDAETANDIPYIDAMLEIEWIVAGAVSSTQTIIARLHNDVIKGAEGVPTDAEPPYPSSTAINDHLADTDIHHTTASLNARDTANRARANHTGTQAQSTVVGLETDLADRLSKSAGGTVAGSTVFAGGATRTNASSFADTETLTVKQLYEIIGGFGQTQYLAANMRNCQMTKSGTGVANQFFEGEWWQPNVSTATGDQAIIILSRYVNADPGSGASTRFNTDFKVGWHQGRGLGADSVMRVNIGDGNGVLGEMTTSVRGAQLEIRNIAGTINGRFNFADGSTVQLGTWAPPVSNPINGGVGTASINTIGLVKFFEIQCISGVLSLVVSQRDASGNVYCNRYFSTPVPSAAPAVLNGSYGSNYSHFSIQMENLGGATYIPQIGSPYISYPFKF